MSNLAARTIDALAHEHDELAALAADLTTDELTASSGADDWSVAQVLSHLGSGAEIGLANLRAALGENDVPDDDFNQSVWDRWNAMTPTQQRDGFLEHNRASVDAFEALTDEQRASLQVVLGFVPQPLTVAAYAGMRLNEVAHHSWDVRVAGDRDAVLQEASATALLEHLGTELGFLLGFIGKADRLDRKVELAISDADFTIVVDDSVSLEPGHGRPTATFAGAPEAVLRLIAGRLRPEHTPESVAVTGNVTLDELRDVFPGY
ncbi:MAG: maleylpyruvate isomerase family mycothiol-dependent enzyme [Propionibacteriales bacterium]|nr:maleylpyruvate isomerase family mycothiol-dependent enzyme [Propionibacteriales bacterium]